MCPVLVVYPRTVQWPREEDEHPIYAPEGTALFTFLTLRSYLGQQHYLFLNEKILLRLEQTWRAGDV